MRLRRVIALLGMASRVSYSFFFTLLILKSTYLKTFPLPGKAANGFRRQGPQKITAAAEIYRSSKILLHGKLFFKASVLSYLFCILLNDFGPSLFHALHSIVNRLVAGKSKFKLFLKSSGNQTVQLVWSAKAISGVIGESFIR